MQHTYSMKRVVIVALTAAGIAALSACGGGSGSETPAVDPGKPSSPGKKLFKQYCTTCHIIGKVMTGPDLTGVLARWNNDTLRIKAYIRNPAKAIEAGDPQAVKAFEEFKPTIMTGFPQLSDQELNDIVAFLKNPD